MHSKPVLIYFDARGRAEPIRMVFKAAKIDFEDRRLKGPECKAASPTGKVPCLQVGDKVYVESLAILLYACELAGFVPKSAEAKLMNYQLVFHFAEFTTLLAQWFQTGDAEQKAILGEKIMKVELPQLLSFMELNIKDTQGETGFVLDGKPSASDFIIEDLVTNMTSGLIAEVTADFMNDYPRVKKVCEAVRKMVAEA